MNLFIKTLFQGSSPHNGEVRVIESFGERRLVAAGYTQSRSLNKNGLTGSYWDGFIQNVPPIKPDSRILILGLAGGTIAKLITNKFGPVAIDGVDIDPLMVKLGQKYFDFHEKNVNIIIEDALEFTKNARYKYDIIAVDLFAFGDVAVGTETESFFEQVKNLVKKDGVVIINKLFESNEKLKDYVKFLEKIFNKIDVVLVGGSIRNDNIIIYASN